MAALLVAQCASHLFSLVTFGHQQTRLSDTCRSPYLPFTLPSSLLCNESFQAKPNYHQLCRVRSTVASPPRMVFLSSLRCAVSNAVSNAAIAKNVAFAVTGTKVVAGPFQTAAQMEIDPANQHFELVPASRPYHPCSVFFDRTLSKFINKGTREGQKALMRELMRDTFTIIKRAQLNKYYKCNTEEERSKIVCDPLAIFLGALANCKPLLITRPVKRGGATYQVPFPLSEHDSEDFAMRWLLQSVKERPKPRKAFFPEVMARELIDCFYNEGKVVKRKQDMHKQCEANKAYAHYRWN